MLGLFPSRKLIEYKLINSQGKKQPGAEHVAKILPFVKSNLKIAPARANNFSTSATTDRASGTYLGHWLAGLIEGDGYIYIPKKSGTDKLYS